MNILLIVGVILVLSILVTFVYNVAWRNGYETAHAQRNIMQKIRSKKVCTGTLREHFYHEEYNGGEICIFCRKSRYENEL